MQCCYILMPNLLRNKCYVEEEEEEEEEEVVVVVT